MDKREADAGLVIWVKAFFCRPVHVGERIKVPSIGLTRRGRAVRLYAGR